MPAHLRATARASALLWATALTLLGATALHAQAAPGAADPIALQAAQNAANGAPGPRSVPMKTIPVPEDVDPATRALVAAPYRVPAWDANPPDAAAWRVLVDKLAQAALPGLTKARAALGVTIAPITVGGVKGFVLTPSSIPEAHKGQVIYNIHGGGYVYGPGESGTAEAMLMAGIGGYKVIAVDYRMPPDAPYPAAMDDADAGYRAVIAATDPTHVAVVGTSTGGGMALALMLRLKAEGVALPGAVAAGTPWADMTETGDTYRTNEWVDNVLVSYGGYLGHAAALYAAGHDLKDPQLSPIYGDFHGLPPTILTSGTRDLFLSNTVRTQQKLREAGVTQELQVYEGISHAQYLFDPQSPLTKEVFGEITRFLDAHLAR